MIDFKDIYKSIDIRTLLVYDNEEWVCLFCIIRATVKDEETVKSIQKKKKDDIDFVEPENVRIVFEMHNEYIYKIIEDFKKGFIDALLHDSFFQMHLANII